MRSKTTKCIICNQEGKKMRGKYCHSCDYKRNKEWFDKRNEERKQNGYYKGKTQYKYSTKAKKFYGEKCMDCGWDKYPEVLQVHHIDENNKNNTIENLAVLCPTCHNVRHFLKNTGMFTPHGKKIPKVNPERQAEPSSKRVTNTKEHPTEEGEGMF